MVQNKRLSNYIMAVATSIVLLLSSSCFIVKYTTSGASIPANARTFSVQTFDNQAAVVEAGLSQQVTDELKEYIQRNSSLTLINQTGDVDFEGAIVNYDVRPVAITANETAAKNRFTITIRVKYNCYIEPEKNYEESFSRYKDFPSVDNFDGAVKTTLTEELLELLIEDIFNKAFVNW